MNRPLTAEEYNLTRWLLEHGKPEALSFLQQLDRAQVSSWKCPCGCASFDFEFEGCPPRSGGMNILADFVFEDGDQVSGIFTWEQNGVLRGVEVYGMSGDAPKLLPAPEMLKPLETAMGVPNKDTH